MRATSIREFIDLAKGNPGKLFYAAGGPPFQVAGEFFKKQVGVDIVYVPYKGTSASVMAAVAGEVSMVVITAGPALSQLRTGKLRGLAVTSLRRDQLVPDIPTLSESGLDLNLIVWVGLFAPARTPSTIIDELAVVLKSQDLRDRVASAGYDTSEMGMPPADFAAFLRTSVVKWSKVAKDLNIRAN